MSRSFKELTDDAAGACEVQNPQKNGQEGDAPATIIIHRFAIHFLPLFFAFLSKTF